MLQRKKVFVSWTIQGRTLGQLAIYWLLYNFLFWHVTFLIETLPSEGVPQPVYDRYVNFCSQHLVWLLCMFVVAPVILWDMVKLTHRVAGPLVRLERAVREMSRGQRVSKITLRPHDMLGQFTEALNELIDAHNGKLDASQANPAWDAPADDRQSLAATH